MQTTPHHHNAAIPDQAPLFALGHAVCGHRTHVAAYRKRRSVRALYLLGKDTAGIAPGDIRFERRVDTCAFPAADQTLLARDICELDALLLAGYEPSSSIAWLGAAPSEDDQFEFLLWPPVVTDHDTTGRTPDARFKAQGFSVRPIRGRGASALINDFCAKHHYLVGGGMNGVRFGLYAPDGTDEGELVGVSTFAPCQNTRTAKGMRAPRAELGEGEKAPGVDERHVWFCEDEYLDCARLCLADYSSNGTALGCGAESFFYGACLKHFQTANRALWRAHRCVELAAAGHLPGPLPHWVERVLHENSTYIKCVRTFADPRAGHVGTIYQAAGAWYLGQSRPGVGLVGARSGEGLARRGVSKLKKSTESGHTHQVLRAVWEGGHGDALLIDSATGEIVHRESLAWIQSAVSDNLPPGARQATLSRAWRARANAVVSSFGTRPSLKWHLRADLAGYSQRSEPGKHRYAHFIAARPAIAYAMARQCRYIRDQIITAEMQWYSSSRRWPRGLGYNWQRRPAKLGLSVYPRQTQVA